MFGRRTCVVACLLAVVVPCTVHWRPAAIEEFLNHPKVQEAKVEALKQFAVVKDHLQTQSAEALVKMQAVGKYLGKAYQEYSANTSFHGLEFVKKYYATIQETIVQKLREHNFSSLVQQLRESVLKHGFELYKFIVERASELLERASELYNLSFERASELYNLSFERAPELYNLSFERASQLKVYLQSDQLAADLKSMLQWLQKDQPASAIAALRALQGEPVQLLLALLAATTVLFAFYRIVCCRRRRVSATPYPPLREAGAPTPLMKILKAPTPVGAGVRERVYSRRRSESPAPIASTADDENMAPAADHLLQQLSTCSLEDLVAIPGLGDKSAAKIVSWRNKNGPLKNMNDLTKVGLSNIVVSNLRKQQLHN